MAENTSDSDGSAAPVGAEHNASAGKTVAELTVGELRDWLREWVAEATGVSTAQISDDRPMEEFGLSSRDAVSLGADIEDKTGVVLTATVVYQHPTIASLAQRIIDGDPDEGVADDIDDESYERERPASDDIAIVGLSTRFPGAGYTPEETWDLLINGRDGVGDLPEGRWAEFTVVPRFAEIIDKANVQGGYLDDVTGFDADFFQMSPREVEMVDPQQRLVLELAWEALEHAHIPPSDLKGAPVGVFIGSSTNDYQLLAVSDPESSGDTAAYALTGTSTSIVANRVSYYFDFRGPSIAMDTACSSSLVAVHQAVRSLRSGESEVALAGGVNMIITPAATLGFDSIGVQAENGKIKAFSADADGMIRAEGGGLFVLKRLSDARRDGDQVLAVIAGSAVNSDGRSNGLPAPNPDAQVDVLRAAYRDAAINPRQVDYIEAHGTGTILGDPIEADALGRVVGRGRDADAPVLLGSAKTNFGHMESAAGAGALAKVVLALQNNEIPPSLNYAGPNPYIQFEATHLKVADTANAWPRYSGLAIAGVSGFGFGGTNAHLVIREVLPGALDEPGAPLSATAETELTAAVDVSDVEDLGDGGSEDDDDDYLTEVERLALAKKQPQKDDAAAGKSNSVTSFAECAVEGSVVPLVISGFISSRRRKAAAELLAWLETDRARNTPLVDIGRALARRNHGRTRSVVMARTHDEAIAGVRAVVDGKQSPTVYTCDSPDAVAPVWLLSGFGSQHRKMAKQLYSENPIFAAAVDRVDALIQAELGYSMVEMFLDDGQTYELEAAQIGIFTIQIGLAELLRYHGAEPGVLVPHSMGEAAAAYISGGLSLEDTVRVICQRSRLMGEGEATLSGDDIRLMALVEYSADDIVGVLTDYPDLEICVYAAPTHTVIGGPESQVDAIVARAEAEGKLGRKLATKGAGHTSQVDPLLGEFAYEITGIEPRGLKVGLYSSVDREQFYRAGHAPIHTIDYFTKGLRHSVWFSQAVAKAVEAGHLTFVELSPNPVVLMSAAAVAFGAGVQNVELVQTLKRKEDESYGVVNALMKLYVHGQNIDVASLFGPGDFADIPRTRFERKTHWLTANVSAGGSAGTIPGSHVELPDGRHAWEVNAAAVTDPHELMMTAAAEILPNVNLGAVEVYSEVPAAGILTTMLTPHPGGASVAVHAKQSGVFTPLAHGVVHSGDVPAPASPLLGTQPAGDTGRVESEPDVADDIGARWSPDSGESVEDRLAVIVGESMGYEPEDLPREIPLIELGLDSLMAVRIKNRVEYEFEIPQLQLQAMREANLADVVKFVGYAVEHRDEVATLAESAQGQGDLDAAALAELIDATPQERAVLVEQAVQKTAENREDEAVVTAAGSDDEPTTPAVRLTDQAAVADAAGVDVPPRDAAERLTFAVWATVTGKSAGGIFTPLPVLAEETAEKLTAKLSERAGGEIDIEDVIDADTIETLANYVREHLEDSAPTDGFLRFLRIPGDKRYGYGADDIAPMLVFHPAGGSTAAYEPLLKRLPESQPVIGFDRVEGSIEERVAQYLPKLREVQPHGPYVLVGWSLGGVLAYGCAQRLAADGEEVALVGFIDLVMPKHNAPETPETKRARLERWKAFAVKTYGIDPAAPLPMDRLVEADDEGQFQIIMEMLAMSDNKIPGGIIEHQRTSFLDNRALASIEPTSYDGKVVLYRADKMHDGAIELEPQFAEIDPDGGWGPFIDNLEIVHIGGDHLAIVDEPYIARIGADLTDRLARISADKNGK